MKLKASALRPREAAHASYQIVNVGAAQVLKDMPDAGCNSGCLATKDAAPDANAPQQMVNFAHHAEVAILDENALTTL